MLHAGHKAAAIQLAQGGESQNGDSEASDNQAHSVDGIGVSHGLQAAEHGIAHADLSRTHTDDGNGGKAVDSEHALNIENLHQGHRTGAEDGRQHRDDIGHQEQQGEQAHGEGVIAHLKKLWDGGDSAPKEPGQEAEGQHHQGKGRSGLPSHRAHIARKGLGLV